MKHDIKKIEIHYAVTVTVERRPYGFIALITRGDDMSFGTFSGGNFYELMEDIKAILPARIAKRS